MDNGIVVCGVVTQTMVELSTEERAEELPGIAEYTRGGDLDEDAAKRIGPRGIGLKIGFDFRLRGNVHGCGCRGEMTGCVCSCGSRLSRIAVSLARCPAHDVLRTFFLST